VAVFGTGIVPSGNLGTELSYVTRRAFVPLMVVQLYNSSPTLASLLANSQTAYGGVSQVTVPVQGAQYVNGQWSDYSGSFNQPATLQGSYVAEYNLKLYIVPIPFLGMEAAVQLDHAIIPLVEARLNDATNTTMQDFSNALFANTTNPQAFIGFPGAIDDGTNMTTYGNINRSNFPFWNSKRYTATSINPSRQLMLQYIAGVVKNSAEVPSFGVCGFGTWTLLAQDFQGQEQYVISPGAGFDSDPERPRSAFRALDVAGVPIYADPYMPEGTLYFVQNNYLNLYVHQNASFNFTGFETTLSNMQLGYIGAVVTIGELVSTKPKSMGVVTGLNSLTL
jgi:hypothetical protein